MSADLSKAYDLLGVKPGVSSKELKAAHRDLAKVWHPDRFLHDPRLQEKAQEKLKEINEAYELLSSRKTWRPSPPPTSQPTPQPHAYSVAYAEPKRGTSGWLSVVLMFVAVFAVASTVLLKRSAPRVQNQEVVVEQPPGVEEKSNQPVSRRQTKEEPVAEAQAAPEPVVASEPTAAVTTVTVTIDPESGLLAKPECRLRSRMTYPIGGEPGKYCNLSHAPPPKDGKIKSAVKWLESQ